MKKISLLLLLLSVSFVTFANPLFFRGVKYIMFNYDDEMAYYYDKDRNLLGGEDMGESGYVYNANGTMIGSFRGQEGFASDQTYYYKNKVYIGKAIEKGKEVIIRDKKDRQVAKYVLTDSTEEYDVLTLSGSIQSYLD